MASIISKLNRFNFYLVNLTPEIHNKLTTVNNIIIIMKLKISHPAPSKTSKHLIKRLEFILKTRNLHKQCNASKLNRSREMLRHETSL